MFNLQQLLRYSVDIVIHCHVLIMITYKLKQTDFPAAHDTNQLILENLYITILLFPYVFLIHMENQL